MEKISEQIKHACNSKILAIILYILGILIIAKIIFSVGVLVGFRKASFERAWEEHYNENFGMGHPNPNLGGLEKIGKTDNFPNAHGTTGKIIKIELPKIIVQDKDGTEKVLSIESDTKIQKGRTELSENNLQVDDFIVVIGTPDTEGIIEAKLIRVIPSPEFLK